MRILVLGKTGMLGHVVYVYLTYYNIGNIQIWHINNNHI